MALPAAGRLALLLLLALALALSAQAARPDPGLLNDEAPVLQQSIVDRVNSNKNAGWKAGMTARFEGAKLKDLKRLCGSLITPVNSLEPSIPVRTYPKDLELPKFFDSREAWPHCSTVSTILDQGHCGSCWAFGAVESLTDRFCTVANVTVTLSENDLLSCCGFECGFGCDGGYPYKAWQYFQRTGVVTSQCNPYFDATGCGHPGCSPVYETPKCVRECVNDEVWTDSKHYGVSVYGVSSNPRDIMAEIYQNGPVEVSFIVYEDFAHYESGVYKHLYGQVSGGHAVKLIGWGTTDDGIDYWLLVNSWNKNWGENGYFRMIRGINDCGIEGSVVAGLPNTQNLLHAAY